MDADYLIDKWYRAWTVRNHAETNDSFAYVFAYSNAWWIPGSINHSNIFAYQSESLIVTLSYIKILRMSEWKTVFNDSYGMEKWQLNSSRDRAIDMTILSERWLLINDNTDYSIFNLTLSVTYLKGKIRGLGCWSINFLCLLWWHFLKTLLLMLPSLFYILFLSKYILCMKYSLLIASPNIISESSFPKDL
jgi:hypothetical protein